ncbi:hypothetical protein AXK12_03030 [Cephaloticoccus capnophilus]|uniref:Cyclophilin-like domain-containing protein n=1 Tax=Cephaloticoccus capnophilus TaxID=1548208 RepID=A0A139SQD5_9BACT|nr:cyclophilin-like fold protein [Cephaloticoccus capnophilus]KXU36742.1 hypothetical protein AXK12_03030 [Cephaloticoccus capnophilus]
MKILLKTASTTLAATLLDTPTARDLFAQLPLTLDLNDYAGTEKIAYLPRKLTTHDAPAGSDPELGSVAYYAPWGNLALFYKDFGYSRGLILLGSIEGDAIATLARLPNGKLTLERAGSPSDRSEPDCLGAE